MDGRREPQRTHHEREARLARVASDQLGLFTREQAVRLGYTPTMISKRLASGLWRGVDRNVYAFASTPSSWRQRVLAACLAGPAVASHRAAGWLWSLPGMGGDHVEVTALRHRRRRASDVIWHESFHLEARDVTEVDGIPVTRPVRTFLDLASLLSESHLEEVLNEGIRRNLMSVPAVGLRLQQLGQLRRGAGRARRVLESYVPGQRPPESVLETRYLQLIRSAGLPIGFPQYEVQLPDGRHARVDFAYPELGVGVELDGEAYHYGERADRRDRTRENELGALGLRILRFDWEDVTKHPDDVVQLVRTALKLSA